MSFGAWLKNYSGNVGRVYNLQSDFLQDCRDNGVTPSEYKTPDKLLYEMRRIDACVEAIDTLYIADELWRRTKKHVPQSTLEPRGTSIEEEWRAAVEAARCAGGYRGTPRSRSSP